MDYEVLDRLTELVYDYYGGEDHRDGNGEIIETGVISWDEAQAIVDAQGEDLLEVLSTQEAQEWLRDWEIEVGELFA